MERAEEGVARERMKRKGKGCRKRMWGGRQRRRAEVRVSVSLHYGELCVPTDISYPVNPKQNRKAAFCSERSTTHGKLYKDTGKDYGEPIATVGRFYSLRCANDKDKLRCKKR